MSIELTKARQNLTQVRTFLKQGNPASAVQSIHSALTVVIGAALMKSERVEFEKLIAEAVDYLTSDRTVREIFPLQMVYTAGNERMLLDVMRDMNVAMAEHAVQKAQEEKEAKEAKKMAWFQRGVNELSTSPSRGLATLASVVREHHTDANLQGLVGEALLNHQFYEEAVHYLTAALDMKPDMIYFYNIIGMALRKQHNYSMAETYYLRASKYLRNDPNLYFNIGRLYIDWKKWDRACTAAMAALKLDPEFDAAQKMLKYAEKEAEKEAALRD